MFDPKQFESYREDNCLEAKPVNRGLTWFSVGFIMFLGGTSRET